MKKVTNMTLALSLAVSVMSVPVYASTGLSKSIESQSTPAVTLSDSNSDDVKKDTVDSKVDVKESPVEEAKPVTDVKKPDAKEVSQPTEEEISKSDTEAKAVKASVKSTPVKKEEPVKVEVEEVKKTSSKDTKEVVKKEEPKKVEKKESVVKKEATKQSTKKFVEDFTKKANKNGIPVEIAYVANNSEFIPTFTLNLRDGKGKLISSTPVGKQNYNAFEGKYKIVLKHGGFKLGDKLRIQLSNVGKGVSGLNLTSNKQVVKGDDVSVIDYDVKPNQYMPIEVMTYEYMVDESKKTWGKELTPSSSTPILGELVTQAKQSAVQVKSTTGSPVKNATVYLQFSPNKQMKVKTDNNGLVWFNKSDVVDSAFTVAVLKYDFVGTLLNHPTVG